MPENAPAPRKTKKRRRKDRPKEASVTVRLDPKLKFGLELLARQQRRTLSSMVESILWEAVNKPPLEEVLDNLRYEIVSEILQHHEPVMTGSKDNFEPPTAMSPMSSEIPLLDEIWDPEPADRLVKLALKAPDLLTFEEQKIWKSIRENPNCWTEDGEPSYSDIRANYLAYALQSTFD